MRTENSTILSPLIVVPSAYVVAVGLVGLHAIYKTNLSRHVRFHECHDSFVVTSTTLLSLASLLGLWCYRRQRPTQLFSAAPTAAEDDDFLDFSYDDIFFHQHFRSLMYNDDDLMHCNVHFLPHITAMHYLNYRTAQWTGANAKVQPSLTWSAPPTLIGYTDDALCDVIGSHKYDTTAHVPYALISVSWLELLCDPVIQAQALEEHDTLGNTPFQI